MKKALLLMCLALLLLIGHASAEPMSITEKDYIAGTAIPTVSVWPDRDYVFDVNVGYSRPTDYEYISPTWYAAMQYCSQMEDLGNQIWDTEREAWSNRVISEGGHPQNCALYCDEVSMSMWIDDGEPVTNTYEISFHSSADSGTVHHLYCKYEFQYTLAATSYNEATGDKSETFCYPFTWTGEIGRIIVRKAEDIVITVSEHDYSAPHSPLSFCRNDENLFFQFANGFANGTNLTLSGLNNTSSAQLMGHIASQKNYRSADDGIAFNTVYFFYSGMGYCEGGQPGLLLHNGDRISCADLFAKFAEFNCNVIAILDCCYETGSAAAINQAVCALCPDNVQVLSAASMGEIEKHAHYHYPYSEDFNDASWFAMALLNARYSDDFAPTEFGLCDLYGIQSVVSRRLSEFGISIPMSVASGSKTASWNGLFYANSAYGCNTDSIAPERLDICASSFDHSHYMGENENSLWLTIDDLAPLDKIINVTFTPSDAECQHLNYELVDPDGCAAIVSDDSGNLFLKGLKTGSLTLMVSSAANRNVYASIPVKVFDKPQQIMFLHVPTVLSIVKNSFTSVGVADMVITRVLPDTANQRVWFDSVFGGTDMFMSVTQAAYDTAVLMPSAPGISAIMVTSVANAAVSEFRPIAISEVDSGEDDDNQENASELAIICKNMNANILTSLQTQLPAIDLGIMPIPAVMMNTTAMVARSADSSFDVIGSQAFLNCPNLTEAALTGAVRELRAHAFTDCTRLKNVLMPPNVTTIANEAFPDGIVIAGLSGSFAESYATANNYTFESIGATLTEIGTDSGSGQPIYQINVYPDWAEKFVLTDAEHPLTVTGVTGSVRLYFGGGSYADVPAEISESTLRNLPKDMQVIESEAFCGTAVSCIVLPDGAVSIGSRAFANCTNLTSITIPDSVTDIADDAFAGSSPTFLCSADSAAAKYAQTHGLTVQTPE